MKAEVIEQEVEQQSLTVRTPKGQGIWKAEAQRALREAQESTVDSAESFVLSEEIRQRDIARAAGLKALLNPGCQAADKLHGDLVRDRDECVKPFEDAARTRKQKQIDYRDEQDRIRRLEQARLEAADKKKKEDEALELAATLEAAGATEAAAQVLDEPIRPAPFIPPPSTPKILGFSSRRIYDAKVIDRDAFLSGIVSGRIPDSAWMPDEQFLRKQAGALKEAMNWPGCKLVWKDV